MLCSIASSADDTNDSSRYTFQNYGGEVYYPEAMEFGTNIGNSTPIIENGTERKHLLLQFYQNPNEERRKMLENYGVEFVSGAGVYSFVVSLPAHFTPADLPAESGLRWMGEIPVENKYDNIHGLNVPEWAILEDGQIELWISFYDDVTYEDAQYIANKYSTVPPNFEMYPHLYNCLIRTNESNMPIIANEDLVKRLSYPDGEFVNEDSDASNEIPGLQLIFSVLVFVLAAFIKRE